MDSLIIISAFILDLLLGEPRGLPHPVQCMGIMIERLETLLRRFAKTDYALRIAGAALVITVVSIVFLTTYLVLQASRGISIYFGVFMSILLAYTTISTRGLADAAKAVLVILDPADIHGARRSLSMIVGRDTASLGEKEIVRAVVETVAENTSDGVIAPLFYLSLGGPAFAMAYKAVNTLDSMLGYKNEKYLHFGWAAARLDDLANCIPARLSAILISLTTEMYRLLGSVRMSRSGSETVRAYFSPWRIMLRDRRNHMSPNSGYPEAAVAASLGIRLGGPSSYAGVVFSKPYIGDENAPLHKRHILYAVRLMYGAAVLGTLFAAIIALLISFFLTKTVAML